jgi:IS30 family transposase
MAHKHLQLNERIQIEIALRAGYSQKRISELLARAPSTISAEIRRNGGCQHYHAAAAQKAATAKAGAARRGKCQIAEQPALQQHVHDRLRRGWSPEELSAKLKHEHPNDPSMHTSHESVYRYIYVVANGSLKRELARCLRRQRSLRKPRRRGVAALRGKLPNMTLIDQRPDEVITRATPGHFEGDLIMGEGNRSAVGVLVERTTRFTMLCHLPEKDATSVREAFERKLKNLPAAFLQSLTYDQGKEMAEHQILADNLNIKVYFCHPHSPW